MDTVQTEFQKREVRIEDLEEEILRLQNTATLINQQIHLFSSQQDELQGVLTDAVMDIILLVTKYNGSNQAPICVRPSIKSALKSQRSLNCSRDKSVINRILLCSSKILSL